jgi:hypothetical protein
MLGQLTTLKAGFVMQVMIAIITEYTFALDWENVVESDHDLVADLGKQNTQISRHRCPNDVRVIGIFHDSPPHRVACLQKLGKMSNKWWMRCMSDLVYRIVERELVFWCARYLVHECMACGHDIPPVDVWDSEQAVRKFSVSLFA